MQFENSPDPRGIPLTFAVAVNGSQHHADNIFVNENDQTCTPLSPDEAPGVGANVLLRGYADVRALPAGGVLIAPFVD